MPVCFTNVTGTLSTLMKPLRDELAGGNVSATNKCCSPPQLPTWRVWLITFTVLFIEGHTLAKCQILLEALHSFSHAGQFDRLLSSGRLPPQL